MRREKVLTREEELYQERIAPANWDQFIEKLRSLTPDKVLRNYWGRNTFEIKISKHEGEFICHISRNWLKKPEGGFWFTDAQQLNNYIETNENRFQELYVGPHKGAFINAFKLADKE
jgi:hypothetical protein